MIQINVTSVLVDNQDKALAFYTEKLGFIKKMDIPVDDFKWLTVVSPANQNGIELLLEPMGFAPSRDYQRALKEAGIPFTSFMVDDLHSEYDRLKALGVEFPVPPTEAGSVLLAVLDDTCGNNIQLTQML